jgi:phospholipid/cholesterol/gamma-HCH transport system permease protein
MSEQAARPNPIKRGVLGVGGATNGVLEYVGGVAMIFWQSMAWTIRCTFSRKMRLGRPAIYAQTVRLGVRAVGVIVLVSMCIGLILALQLAPPLDEFGQIDQVANVNAIAIVRELGPLISAIVLTGFAGASIAAELGTMVVGEEIEALEAHALNPIRFLIVPRVLATIVSLVLLTIIGELVALTSGWVMGVTLLDIQSMIYIDNTINQLDLADYFTGLAKACVFGAILGAIACYNGINVSGGAAGVGRATTNTVVHSIVAVIFSDLIFTAIFYRLGWT